MCKLALSDVGNSRAGGHNALVFPVPPNSTCYPRLQFHPDPRQLDAAFRRATAPFASERASKWIGDCYLLAFAKESGATLVTFDKALLGLARKQDCAAILPD